MSDFKVRLQERWSEKFEQSIFCYIIIHVLFLEFRLVLDYCSPVKVTNGFFIIQIKWKIQPTIKGQYQSTVAKNIIGIIWVIPLMDTVYAIITMAVQHNETFLKEYIIQSNLSNLAVYHKFPPPVGQCDTMISCCSPTLAIYRIQS